MVGVGHQLLLSVAQAHVSRKNLHALLTPPCLRTRGTRGRYALGACLIFYCLPKFGACSWGLWGCEWVWG